MWLSVYISLSASFMTGKSSRFMVAQTGNFLAMALVVFTEYGSLIVCI